DADDIDRASRKPRALARGERPAARRGLVRRRVANNMVVYACIYSQEHAGEPQRAGQPAPR
ncbi:MAG: hypothetical protein KC636_10515, partial [Myxococcales bacterium]|nr:hypothetical protein [Myxococcales bacterium]